MVLLSEVHRHLGIAQGAVADAPTWSGIAHLSRQLYGSGFHQELAVNLSVNVGAMPGSKCSLAMLQPLPPAFYGDPYQLDDLSRATHSFGFKLFGPVDLEL